MLTYFYVALALLVAIVGHKRGPGFVVSLLLAIVLTPLIALIVILVMQRNAPATGANGDSARSEG